MLDQNDTTWPLDFIPAPILDGILDHLILMSSRLTAKLPSELKGISLVNKEIRRVILARTRPYEKIVISTEAESEALLQSLGYEAFTQIKSLDVMMKPQEALTSHTRRITERVSKLDELLLFPGLPEYVTKQEGLYSADRMLEDPLHENLKEVKYLNITCGFCTVDRGSRLEARWYRNFFWLLRAKINYSFLDIRIWSSEVEYRNLVASTVNLSEAKLNLDLLGLSTVEVAGRLEYRPKDDMQAFLLALLRIWPAPRTIKITFLLILPDRSVGSRRVEAITYRTVTAKEVAGPPGTLSPQDYSEIIDYRVLHKCVAGAEDWLERSPQYGPGESYNVEDYVSETLESFGW